MLVYEYTLQASTAQRAAMDEAIRVVQFIRNTCLRLWMDARRDERGVSAKDVQLACSRLASAFTFVAPPRFQHDGRSVDYTATIGRWTPTGGISPSRMGVASGGSSSWAAGTTSCTPAL